jgi:4-alpha-glucanotransferase
MRTSGILLAVSSLPSQHGVGDFGQSAYQFIDALAESGMTMWQVLPLNPLGYGNSPYQPYSSKAMDELYISLDLLVKEGYLSAVKPFKKAATKVNYDEVRTYKKAYLLQAFAAFKPHQRYQQFLKDNPWVETYAIFMTFKTLNELRMWTLWPKEFKTWVHNRSLDLTPYQPQINFQQFLQFILYEQFIALKNYANRQGIQLVGDIPIYVGIDSVDVWTNQSQFLLTPDGEPTHIAGVPPDYFSKTGQRWGNPLYNWDVMQKDGFKFWIDRLGYLDRLFDIIRIDHFRAFDTYWKIPASCPTAVEGAWIEAPGYALFDRIKKQLPHLHIIAEDLGDLRPEVLTLRDHYHLPGMKIAQFELPIYPSSDNKLPPAQLPVIPEYTVMYTGTHDNQTTIGWFQKLAPLSQKRLLQLLKKYQGSAAEKLIQFTLNSPANYAIIPMQDILSLTDKARMNTPGTIGSPNWEWKLKNWDDFYALLPLMKSWLKASKRA